MNSRILMMILATLAGLSPLSSLAEKVSDVSQTVHNLSAGGPGAVTAAGGESEICVFCHTPHGATTFPGSPLWNRTLSSATYTTYTSSSLDAENILGSQLEQPAGSSKLCLSCHDGTLALGAVNVFQGTLNSTIGLNGTSGGAMPVGEGVDTGFTRNLGTNLTNDHPISLTYNTNLANVDGELFDPTTAAHIGLRSPGVRPAVPLEPTGQNGDPQIQCVSCHDPHLFDATETESIKFLRLNRFQSGLPAQGAFNETTDIICLACHDKSGWTESAHALSTVANETYISTPPNLREIPVGMPVWQVSCLNCHDTHTVHGARRLLREGTDSIATPKSGGNSAIEETCYQCHSANPIITNINNDVPDIKTDFGLARHMPITSADQVAGVEIHDITDADFSETQTLLGAGNLNNRHVECTDCHNPHRVMKDQLFNGDGNETEGTHPHGSGHTNIASGVLRGSWGVEPNYGGTNFLDMPTSYDVKKGDGGLGASDLVTSAHVTREYQVCLKCHSDYGYTDSGVYPSGGRPIPGSSTGTTFPFQNNLEEYTNQAMEFQAPTADRGEPGPQGAANHRSWHPVMENTGRTAGVRNMSASTNLFLAPWNGANIGVQTMYCSDCHGSNTPNGTVVPPGDNPWGPHGSQNNFILKGTWDANTGGNNSGLCFRCHNHTNYGSDQNENSGGNFASGFGGPKDTNLHALHNKAIGNGIHCSWCHVAVPHGFKNKALLVNLNRVGAEAGLAPAGVEVPINSSGQTYNVGPYYNNAKLKIRTFRLSGTWRDQDCGSASGTPDVGRDWMKDVCSNPP